ncbi:leucine-rich repeat protein [bacterium]|nr:leucine-rich repeat protein [bacterium]
MQLNTDTELQSGKYRILRVLGQGGFGITYLAEHTTLSKKVAVKEFFPKDFCDRDETLAITSFSQNKSELLARLKARFIKEARNLSNLDNPGIVKIHDIFEENGTAYYVMDYIEGENLNDIVKREGALPEKRAVDYIRKIGMALSYLHSRKMTHFDIKPANIMIRSSDDMPILIDFGLSKQYDSNGDATSTLMQGISSGYSPIEMYNTDTLTAFAPQSDIYSLGATLYYLLTGRVPPTATDLLSKRSHLFPIANKRLDGAIKKAMEPVESNRPRSVDEWMKNFGRQTGGKTKRNRYSRRKLRRFRWLVGIACIMSLLAAFGCYGYINYYAEVKGGYVYKNGIKYEIIQGDSRYLKVIGTNTAIINLALPSKLWIGNGFCPVTTIGKYAFYKCSSLTSVTIPGSVTTIAEGAFSGCSSLRSVTIPSSVTSIGGWAFSGCSSLTSVTIPSSVTSIGGWAFNGCRSLTSVTIPSSVTSIGGLAFSGCSSLRSVTIPSSVTSIGGSVFSGCSSLRSVTIPSSVTSIGGLAFNGCSSLTGITIPSSVTKIGQWAFSDCSSLTSITIPSSVTSIGGFAFNGCSSLTSVTIPSSVKTIEKGAFSDCSSLTSVTIPSSVTEIGMFAFFGCRSLTGVTIPSSVTEIGYEAFPSSCRINRGFW